MTLSSTASYIYHDFINLKDMHALSLERAHIWMELYEYMRRDKCMCAYLYAFVILYCVS